jgi:hypothetical protein
LLQQESVLAAKDIGPAEVGMVSKSASKLLKPTFPKKNSPVLKCFSCGGSHRRSECKFRQAVCHFCSLKGHIAKVCKKKFNESSRTGSKSLEVDHVTGNGCKLFKTMIVKGKSIAFQVDTGSPITILPKSLAYSLALTPQSCSMEIKSYSGHTIDVVGTCDCILHDEDKQMSGNVNLVIVESGKPILGLDALNLFNVINVSSITEHAPRFVVLHRNNTPVTSSMMYKARSLPFHKKVRVEEELRRMLKDGEIVQVKEPIVAAPIVPVVKANGDIRVCGDFQHTANKLIDSLSYSLSSFSEIATQLSQFNVYSKIDLERAYLQLHLDPDSQKLTTIATHVGFFNFTRLPFGINASPRIFQYYIDSLLEGLDGVFAYQDDILIGSSTPAEHDEMVREVKRRLEHGKLKISQNKSVWSVSQLKFLGYIISPGHIKPDPEKIASFTQLRSPKSKDDLKSIIGTLQYYSLFIRNFLSLAAPLFSLLRKNVRFVWNREAERALRLIISEVSKSIGLAMFDESKPIFLSCDASLKGLGAVLSHDREQKQVIWCISRTLSNAEKNYSNIEREALAIIFALKRFSSFLSGRFFTLSTDHRPLKFIFDTSKPVSDRISARLQRWAYVLRGFNFNVVNVAGENMHLPDTLSRLAIPDDVIEISNVDLFMREHHRFTPLLQAIESSQDETIQRVKMYTLRGWPRYLKREIRPYNRDRLTYSVHDNVLYKDYRVVVPKNMRSQVLKCLHEGHIGIGRMRAKAREVYWWPGIDRDIADFVSRCVLCRKARNVPRNADLQNWSETTYPMERVHVDICHVQGQNFLVLVDSFSKFVNVTRINSLTALHVISALWATFKFTGLPTALVSDNATCFTSDVFRNFLSANDILFINSPPYHSQSNGLAERTIQSFKRFLLKNHLQSSPVNVTSSGMILNVILSGLSH